MLTQWDAYVNSILHCVITIFVLIITNNALSQVHDCTSQEAAGVVCSSCRCGLEGSRRIVGGVESTVSCFHFSECDRFVTICHTTPLVRVGNIRGLQHSTFTQRTEPIQAGFVTIIWFSKHHILDLLLSLSFIFNVADAARWVCWHSDILQLGSHCCSLCRVSCKDQLNLV